MVAVQNNKFRLALLLCLLAVAVGLLFARLGFYQPRSVPNAAVASESCSRAANRAPQGSQIQQQDHFPQKRAPDTHEGTTSPANGADSAAVLTIKFVDESGSSASSVQFWLQERGRNTSFSIADNEGIYVLQTRIGSSIQLQACGEPTKVDMGHGSYRLEPSYSAPWASRIHEFRVVAARQHESVTVYAARNLLVRALYDDGQAFVGTYSVHYKRVVRYAHQYSSDGATICGVPVREGVVLRIPAQRPAYDAIEYPLSLAELTSETPLLVTIPRSQNPTGGIRLDFVGFVDSMVEVVLGAAPQREFMTTGNEHRTSSSWLSGPLKSGNYVVLVVGRFAARVEDVKVVGGEITTVKAVAGAPAVVRARIISAATRQPLARAVLELSGASFPDFENLFPVRGVRAISNSEGVAILSGAAAGVVSLTIEAIGYNPETMEVSLNAGGETDLGDIYLEEARGVCVVKINGMKAGVQYALLVRQVGASGAYPWRPISREVERVEGLVLHRRYSIGVVLAGGGEIIYEDVVLTTPDTPFEIELDAAKSLNPIAEPED